MRNLPKYDNYFFNSIEQSTQSSAQHIVPILQQMIQPKSVIDVGCGRGIWLKMWMSLGVTDCLGVDGEYLNNNELHISKSKFQAHDLEKSITIDRAFDLVMSLEVAEHLPASAADLFIASLCRLGKVIVFSAAIPAQEGNGHINEQYPDYWIEKFNRNGYRSYDIIRGQIWLNAQIDKCYRQNILIFAHESITDEMNKLASKYKNDIFNFVHPEYWSDKIQEHNRLKSILHNPFLIMLYYFRQIFKRIAKRS